MYALFFAVVVGAADSDRVDYAQSVKPILSKRCYVCHGAWKQNGGLRLDTGAAIRKGGESGPAAKPGDVKASVLVGAITGSAGFRMPPENEGTPLTADEIQVITQWIEQGADSPIDEQPAADPRTYWSYQPVRRLIPPSASEQTENPLWRCNSIDAFLAAKHVEHGLKPRPQASKETLLRRVFLDLIGLDYLRLPMSCGSFWLTRVLMRSIASSTVCWLHPCTAKGGDGIGWTCGVIATGMAAVPSTKSAIASGISGGGETGLWIR
jgi:hypothetical protein